MTDTHRSSYSSTRSELLENVVPDIALANALWVVNVRLRPLAAAPACILALCADLDNGGDPLIADPTIDMAFASSRSTRDDEFELRPNERSLPPPALELSSFELVPVPPLQCMPASFLTSSDATRRTNVRCFSTMSFRRSQTRAER